MHLFFGESGEQLHISIHTPSIKDEWKFRWGGGLKCQNFKANYDATGEERKGCVAIF